MRRRRQTHVLHAAGAIAGACVRAGVGTAMLVAALVAAAGCERQGDVGPVVVSAIGEPLRGTAARDRGDAAARTLADSVAQGLVRFDAAGQVEPGIAERWIVTDEGTTYIFRLRAMTWSDGRPLRAAHVVTVLRRRTAPRSGNPLAPFLTAITSIVEMTPQVIQIELSRPRPDLLKLFAQPELAITRPGAAIGSGPLRPIGPVGRITRLTPVTDQARAGDAPHLPTPEDDILFIAERPAAAVVRFVARRSDLVTGGTIADWPLLAAAGAPRTSIRRDPAAGLFGLGIAARSGLLASPEGRAAVALAIDRAALVATFATQWPPSEALLPSVLDSAAPPARAAWSAVAVGDRRSRAQAYVATWRAANGAPPVLRIALPAGPGGTMLWGRIAADLYAAGIASRRVAADHPAELRLVDEVAPYDSARWYLAAACRPCGEAAATAIDAARTAPTLAARGQAIAAADAALARDVAFIPIARPLRWSLVAPRLRAWQPNERAWHPLNRLRRDTN